MKQKFYLAPSKIHGKGTFAKTNLKDQEPIDVGIEFLLGWFPDVTSHFGSWINHSYQPNTYLCYRNNAWYVMAKRGIRKDEELTIDYRRTPWYIEGPKSYYR